MSKAPSPARMLDQFYTKRAMVPGLVAVVQGLAAARGLAQAQWLEPSAGDGAFLDSMPAGSLGLDLAPGRADITKGDFLSWSPPASTSWIVVGNPPFGKNSSLAIRFFNRAAGFAELIGFIVPRTFEKVSVHNRLDAHFALLHEQVLPLESFVFEGEDVAIPCVFQVWGRLPNATKRTKKILPVAHPHFTRVTDPTKADFAFQRVGVAAGRVKSMNATALAGPSHHFIHVTDRSQIQAVRARLEALDFSEVKQRTAGNPSISLTEIVALYTESLATAP